MVVVGIGATDIEVVVVRVCLGLGIPDLHIVCVCGSCGKRESRTRLSIDQRRENLVKQHAFGVTDFGEVD